MTMLKMMRKMCCRCDETYDANCDGETTMPFYRAQYDAKTGQSPNMPRYLYFQMF